MNSSFENVDVDLCSLDSSINNESTYFNDYNDEPFKIEFKWEGKVDYIDRDVIYSRMYSVDEDEWDDIEFNISEVSTDDLHLVKEGALFNFYIGYEKNKGTLRKAKKIKFRRILLKSKVDQILDAMNNNNYSGLFKTY
ncbi:MAG TPA: hypothetical protein PKD51_09645 [Saprospiraceae bacterium]|nr:hypothetical protein [Saprospiraceae bacterium]HMU03496.1 hypothetical protein [Saprospiraceae bacterium]